MKHRKKANRKKLNHSGKQLLAAGKRAPYDKEALNILKDKQYLARILKECTTEFQDMEIEDIIPCIDEPAVSKVPVEPGLTNSAIKGDLTESKVIGEGLVTYDLRFSATVPATKKKMRFRLLFDVELQQKEHPGYDIVSRGVLYGGRMLSEQMGREVTGKDYDKLQKVYSIWICTNSALSRANTISRYSITHSSITGTLKDNARSDLLQVIVIRLPGERYKQKPKNEPTPLIELLSATFSKNMDVDDKLRRIEELGVKLTDKMKGQVNTMCNLSQGILEEGIEIGERRGERKGIEIGERRGERRGIKKGERKGISKGRLLERQKNIRHMLKSGKSPQAISAFCNYPLQEIMDVQKCMEKKKSK